MTITLPKAVAGLAAACALTMAGAAPALASPVNASTALTGSFFGCTNGDSGTFVTNSGNSHAPTTWQVAHLTFSSGGAGVFIPTSEALMLNGSPLPAVGKGSTSGSVTCSISATEDGVTLSGTVTGNIVTTS